MSYTARSYASWPWSVATESRTHGVVWARHAYHSVHFTKHGRAVAQWMTCSHGAVVNVCARGLATDSRALMPFGARKTNISPRAREPRAHLQGELTVICLEVGMTHKTLLTLVSCVAQRVTGRTCSILHTVLMGRVTSFSCFPMESIPSAQKHIFGSSLNGDGPMEALVGLCKRAIGDFTESPTPPSNLHPCSPWQLAG